MANAILDTYTNNSTTNFNGSLSLSHAGTNVPTPNRVAIMCFESRKASGITGMTVLYGGVAMTYRGGYDAVDDTVAVWTLDNPPLGTQTVAISGGTNHASNAYMTVATFFSDGYESFLNGNNTALTFTTANSLGAAMGCTCSCGHGTLTETSGTEIYYASYATSYDVACSYKLAVAPTTVLSWTNAWNIVGVAIKGYSPPGIGFPVAITPNMMI